MADHACPGCGRGGINPNRLSCPRCWYRLPVSLRAKITASWRQRASTGSREHREVLVAALAWYRDNPPFREGPALVDEDGCE